MTASQIIACAIAWTAAIVAITGLVLVCRARGRRAVCPEFTVNDGWVTVTESMSETEYEALKARWLKEHGSPHAAHRVKELRPVAPVACSAFRPSADPVDSGLCAGCGMYDYKHRESS